MAQEKRVGEETMDKNILCYCTPNFRKLVCHVPLCDGVLASCINYWRGFVNPLQMCL